jgi:cytosine/adenosine deaminase-related metal-dependent hydrolase
MGKSKKILIQNAMAIATMDDQEREFSPGSILIEGNKILKIGESLQEPADEIIDATGKVVLPGLINTHHHLFQTLTRNLQAAQDKELFDWLTTLYEVWREITPEAVYLSALVGLGELLLTGCTTSSDHLYLFPAKAPGNLIDMEIQAARELGIRFHATRGSMSLGKSKGGLPPDDCCQSPDVILKDAQRLIETYHDPEDFSMLRLALAPCSPFSVTADLLKETAALARQYQVRLHTHLAETKDEENFCLEHFGMRPLDYMEEVDWLGPDVWYAHGIYFNESEIRRLAQSGTGVCHCPVSNLRLASGICPVVPMLEAGVPIGLGVDGSASNDSSDFLGEVRQCMLIHRYASGVTTMPARKALHLATRGSASLLGREDIGSLEPGKAADLIMIDLNRLGYAGALHDPIAAIVFAGDSHIVDTSIVNGKIVVKHGKLVFAQEMEIIQKTNQIAQEMVSRAHRKTHIDFNPKKYRI